MLCINISCHHRSCYIQRHQDCELQYPTHQCVHPNLYQCNWLQEHQTCRHQIDDFLLQHYPLESGGNCAHDDWVHLILEKVWKTLDIFSCFRKVYFSPVKAYYPICILPVIAKATTKERITPNFIFLSLFRYFFE